MVGLSSPAPELTPRDVRDYPVAGKPYKPAPLTVRYKNPGALEFKPWMSRYGATVGENGRYAQFPTEQHGYDAMSHVLNTYGKRGQNTVRTIIGGTPGNPELAWAPRGVDRNSTDQYITAVAGKLGVDPDHPLGPEHRQSLMRAMAGYEAGRPVAGPVASASPSPQTASAPMAQGLSAPAPSDVPPPSNQQIDLWRARGQNLIRPAQNVQNGWGAIGAIVQGLAGNMWMDQAARGAQQQVDDAAKTQRELRGIGAGLSSPAPSALPASATPPVMTASTTLGAGFASPAPTMSAGAPAIGNNGAGYAPVAPLSAKRPQITGLSSPAPVSTGDAAQGATLDAQPAPTTPPVQSVATPQRTAPVPAGQNALSRFDDSGRWMGPQSAGAPTIDVGEGETPYAFPPGQGRMNAGLSSPAPVPGTAQGSAFMFDARNAHDPFKSQPAATPAPAQPVQGLAAQTGAPRPQSITGPQRTPDDYQRRIDVLGRMMLNPLTAPFAQQEMQRLSLEMGPDAQLKRRAMELGITKDEEAIASSRRMNDVVTRFLDGGASQGGGAVQGVAAGAVPSGAPAPMGQGAMPPGTVPSGMQANSETMPGMPPLSAEAARAQRLIELGGLLKDRAMVQAGQAILNADPSYEARKKQSEKMGEANATRAESSRAGAQIMKAYAQLRDYFDKLPDADLLGAIGARNTTKLKPESPLTLMGIPLWNRPTTVDPKTGSAVAGEITPVQRESIMKPTDAAASRNWNAQNTFHHLIHGLTNSLITNAGKGLNMSDARQAEFASTMQDFMHASDRASAAKILDHAKSIIVNDFGLTHDQAQGVVEKELAGMGATHGAAARTPAVGAVEDGHVFIGGNPADQASWVKAR